MKKVFYSVLALACTVFTANAQEEAEGFKAKSGDVAVELGLSGGILNTASNLNSSNSGSLPSMLKVRYFLNDKMAVRASFNFSSVSEKSKVYDTDNNGNDTKTSGYQKLSNGFYGFNLGVEKHFKGTNRLATYLGGDLTLAIKSAKLVEEKYHNGRYDEDYSKTIKGTNANGNGGFGFGLRAVTGAEYYFVKKAYIGLEAGWGFLSMKDSRVKSSVTTPDGTGLKTVTKDSNSPGGSFQLVPAITGSVRIGYIF